MTILWIAVGWLRIGLSWSIEVWLRCIDWPLMSWLEVGAADEILRGGVLLVWVGYELWVRFSHNTKKGLSRLLSKTYVFGFPSLFIFKFQDLLLRFKLLHFRFLLYVLFYL